mmetsp:Transcript_2431/g.8925  ORF Transcript_2431/g.8925 Transcript_2431/m.8925 type:complete len:222 (-) Transcript_2431:65-730(-)
MDLPKAGVKPDVSSSPGSSAVPPSLPSGCICGSSCPRTICSSTFGGTGAKLTLTPAGASAARAGATYMHCASASSHFSGAPLCKAAVTVSAKRISPGVDDARFCPSMLELRIRGEVMTAWTKAKTCSGVGSKRMLDAVAELNMTPSFTLTMRTRKGLISACSCGCHARSLCTYTCHTSSAFSGARFFSFEKSTRMGTGRLLQERALIKSRSWIRNPEIRHP